MKTPEEIKKGLEYCGHAISCFDCPYFDGDDCEEALEDDTLALIQQLETQVPKWISVKERLPEKSGYCLCWIPKYTTTDVIHYSAKHMAFNAFDTTCIPESVIPVTHWMPLPQPPKED